MVADSLKSKTIDALSWSFVQSVVARSIQFVIGIVLARLLLPEQFGLIGMMMIFMAVAQSVMDSGFGAALIQKQQVTSTDLSSVFYFNIILGLFASVALCLIAPWVAAFYNQPILSQLMRAMSLSIVINSLSLVQTTILDKAVDFKTQTKVSLLANLSSGGIGIVLAAVGFGVWSLVVQQVSSALIRTISLWQFSSWRPSATFSFKSIGNMFGFGSRLMISWFLDQLFSNIYMVVIGKLFSATDLGFFSRAQSLQQLPSQTFAGVVDRVTFPVFATIQGDPVRLKKGLKKALIMLVLVNFPMMIGLSVIARPLIIVLLTEKWTECIPYFQVLCFSGLLFPLHAINLNFLRAIGRSDLFLRLEIIKKVLIVINIAITWRWGISAIIYGIIILSIISYYLNSYYTGLLIGYQLREQLLDLSPYLVFATLMGSILYLLGFIPFPNQWSLLLVQIILGIFIYGFLCRLFQPAVFTEIWRVGKERASFLRA
jgi:O-antigen/teichoic acid export membrane protein